jgi:CIC family chloride channel protein
VLQAVAAEIGTTPPPADPAQPAGPAQNAPAAEPPLTPLPGYHVLEVTLGPASPAAGMTLGSIRWPTGTVPVAVLRHRSLQEPDPGLILAAGDRVSLLAPVPDADGNGRTAQPDRHDPGPSSGQ